MKRRTRLRKQGLPPDPPRSKRAVPPGLLELSVQLTQALSTQTALPPSRIHALATNFDVLADVQKHGVQRVADFLARYGMTPTDIYGRFA